MHDFSCTNPDDMYYEALARKARYYKQDEKGLDADASHTGKISDDKGINAIILSDVVKGFLIVPDFLWIGTVNPDREWGQPFTSR